MKPNYDIVIVGGGMVGTALACALGGADFKVAVIEHEPPAPPADIGYDLRVSAITLASQALFEHLGAWTHMADRRVSPVRGMEVWESGGHGRIAFDAAEIGEPCLAWIIENRLIQRALLERLHQHTNIHWLCPAAVASFDLGRDGSTLVLTDGRALGARLVVGADGAESAVRRAAGIEIQTLGMDQKAIVATVRTEQPHAAIARQNFLPTGPLAFLPLDEPHTCSIVWSADTALADELLALDETAFTLRLRQAFGTALGAIQVCGPHAGFPLALRHARAYTGAGLALVGDAAHTVHPLAGQGVNLGMLDAAALAEVLCTARARKRDYGAEMVLRRYERWRKADNLSMIAITGGFRYLFGNEWPLLRGLRGAGLGLTDRATPLKNIIMRRAAGLAGDLPPLARRDSVGPG